MNALLGALGRGLAGFLTKPVPGGARFTTSSERALAATIRPGDVLLVEGHSRVSAAIKYLTQSTWSHAALHVGPIPGAFEPDGEPHVLVEAELGQGVICSPLSRHATTHCRICRPVGLSPDDLQRLIDFAISRIGNEYDLRNMFDLARYLMPTPPVPQRFRRRMLSIGSGSPTRAICSTLIAEAFGTVRYPILPIIEELPTEYDSSSEAHFKREVLHIRHHSLYAPRDFDISPYFEIVKPTLAQGFDYHALAWAEPTPAAG